MTGLVLWQPPVNAPDGLYDEEYDAAVNETAGLIAAEFACLMLNECDDFRFDWSDYRGLVNLGLTFIIALGIEK